MRKYRVTSDSARENNKNEKTIRITLWQVYFARRGDIIRIRTRKVNNKLTSRNKVIHTRLNRNSHNRGTDFFFLDD